MNSLLIFGTKYRPRGRKEDGIQRKLNQLIAKSNGKENKQVIKAFLADLLYSELTEIYGQILADNNIEVFGNMDFEIADSSIDKKRQRIAKIKGNKMLVKLNAVSLPKSALRYIVAHEMAHLITKKHGKRFWKVMASIYPAYEEGQKLFSRNEEVLKVPLNLK
jgi:predicted metal-dependent hydrolase